jgi:PAS domain S-box-containing protein
MSPSNPVNDDKNSYAIDPSVYVSAFQSSKIAMAIATLGGNFIDCNSTFVNLVGAKSKEEVCEMTIFNCIDEAHLHKSFELICSIVIKGAHEDFVVPSRLPMEKNLHTLIISLTNSEISSHAYFSVSLLKC